MLNHLSTERRPTRHGFRQQPLYVAIANAIQAMEYFSRTHPSTNID